VSGRGPSSQAGFGPDSGVFPRRSLRWRALAYRSRPLALRGPLRGVPVAGAICGTDAVGVGKLSLGARPKGRVSSASNQTPWTRWSWRTCGWRKHRHAREGGHPCCSVDPRMRYSRIWSTIDGRPLPAGLPRTWSPACEAVAKVRHAREGGHPCECVGLHKVVAAWPPGCRRQTRVEELGAPMNAWLRKIGRRTRRRLRGLATLMDSRVRGCRKVRHAREGGHPCECVGLHKVVAAWPPGCRRQTRVEELGAPMNAWLRKIGRRTRRRLRGLATLMDSRVRGNDEQARCVHDS
jgi:hypothetical protein